MHHPLDFIPGATQKKVFFALLALTLGLFGVFRWLDAPLRTPAAPNGIVSFELAGTPEQAESIIQSWDARARLFAAFGLGLDYVFMPAYALTISLGVLMALRKHSGVFSGIGIYVGWGALLAALLDAIENIALWRLLAGISTPFCPRVAAVAATIKFALIMLGLLFALAGWLLPKK
jgi:hypothetical protein